MYPKIFSVYFFLLSFFIVGIESILIFKNQQNKYENITKEIHFQLNSTLSKVLLTENKEIIYAYLEGLINNPYIDGISIRKLNSLEDYVSIGIQDKESSFQLTYPIYPEPHQKIATLHFFSSSQSINKNFWSMVYPLLFCHLLFALFSILLMKKCLLRYFLEPIKIITNNIKLKGLMEIDATIKNFPLLGPLMSLIQEKIYFMLKTLDEVKTNYTSIQALNQKNLELIYKLQRDQTYLYEHLDQGIFTINRKYKVDEMYSKKCLDIYHLESMKKIDLKALLLNNTTMSESEKNIFWSTIVNSLGEDIINYEFNAHLLPKKYEKMIQGEMVLLEFKWKSISMMENNVEICDKIMIFVKSLNRD